MSLRIRIGFVHRFDARNLGSWSGTFYCMAKALEAHAGEVVYLGPDNSRITRFIIDNTYRVDRWLFRLTGKHWITDLNRVLSWRLANVFERRLKEQPCDILFAAAASVEIAHLNTDLPIIYFSDLVWADLVEYYPQFSSMSSFAIAEGDRIEDAAIHRAAAVVYPSDWAVDGARKHYGASPGTTFKVCFGANLSPVPTREEALNHPLSGPVRLLLAGVDWERKGGAIAFECLTSLGERGVDAELTVCGCVPPQQYQHPKLRVVPFLDKNDPEQQKKLAQLFLESNFLLFPTRADATPIATCEASAYGLPALVTDTGGTRGSVREGLNGFLLPMEARGGDYADLILKTIADPAGYRELVASSRDQFEQFLNWDAWGKSLCEVMQGVLDRKTNPTAPASEEGRKLAPRSLAS